MRDRALALVLLVGVALTGCTSGSGDEAAESGPVVVEAGVRWPLNLTADDPVESVTGGAILTNEGEDASITSVGLVSPEHTLTFREVTLGPGGSDEVALTHAFNDTAGPAGTYQLVVYAEDGAITVTDARIAVDRA